jgi:hypothetical protein
MSALGKKGRSDSCRISPFWRRKQTSARDDGVQTKLQTNHAAQSSASSGRRRSQGSKIIFRATGGLKASSKMIAKNYASRRSHHPPNGDRVVVERGCEGLSRSALPPVTTTGLQVIAGDFFVADANRTRAGPILDGVYKLPNVEG